MKAFWSAKRAALKASSSSKSALKPSVLAASKLNALKKDAKGDAKVPVPNRVYVYVQRPASTYNDPITGKPATRPEKTVPAFFAKDTVVGRAFDSACDLVGISKKTGLGLYAEDIKLSPSDKLGSAVTTGQTLVVR